MLNIERYGESGQVRYALEGRLDTLSSPGLEERLMKDLPNITELIIDLKNLKYLSSAGLRTLVTVTQAMEDHGTMKVVNVNPTIMNILVVTGLDDLFAVE